MFKNTWKKYWFIKSYYYTWKNIKNSYNNNKSKISAPTWNDKFELNYGPLFWEYLKKHGASSDKTSIRIYLNKIENRTTFVIKDGYYLEFLTIKTTELHGKTENKITRDEKWWKCTTSWNYWRNISSL